MATVIDLAAARARRAALPQRPRITAEAINGRVVFTFPFALHGLSLSRAEAEFWRDNIDNLITALDQAEE